MIYNSCDKCSNLGKYLSFDNFKDAVVCDCVQDRQSLYNLSRRLNTVVLMRGVSGSGKSTLARDLAILTLSKDSVIVSADENFMSVDGKYLWSVEGLKHAHALCKLQALEAMKRGIRLIIVDNTNLSEKERGPYEDLASDNTYNTTIMDVDTPWCRDAEECFKKNTHGVPLETIQRQLKKLDEDKDDKNTKIP